MPLPRANQHSGPLAGHVRSGRKFRPPLAASGVLNVGDWVRDDLPDLLWPVLTLSQFGTRAALRFVRWQGSLIEDLAGLGAPSFIADCLDGRLTGLDRLVTEMPEAETMVVARAAEWDLLSDGVVRALASYPFRPAKWLTRVDFAPPGQPEIDLLARAVVEVLRDGHREAVIKCLYIWSAVQAGTFSTSAETIDLLKNYPNDDATRGRADSVIRATWDARKGLLIHQDADHFAASIRWAKVFWGGNSMTTRCVRKRDIDRDEPDEIGSSDAADEVNDVDTPGTAGLASQDFRQRAMDLMSSYVEAVETSPSRLYDQEREEVHTGLVSRAAREVVTALGAPDLWCSEHGAHVGRMLAETRILLAWMAAQDQETIYRRYQEFGAGKAKLYSLIAKEIPKAWFVDGVSESIDRIAKASHNDAVIDHRVVDISATFADGKSLRDMATECGLIDLYRHSYQLDSGIVHSEWWSVEIHAMERCLNVLHRGHLIPSLSLSAGANEGLARAWLTALYGLMRASLDILQTPAEVVADAFAWLTGDVPATAGDAQTAGADDAE